MTGALIIRVEDAPVRAHVGVSEEERTEAQTLIVSTTITLEEPAKYDDRIHSTIDYDRIINYLREGLGEARLIETLAAQILAFCFTLSPRVVAAETTIKKPSVLQGEGCVSVTLRRQA
ncbi:MAG: dihydroneopterin aldolase [Hyphomonadaceae bacterium]|nr:dihydroneopterin aldolase [Hyphomonadaceae bacterium]